MVVRDLAPPSKIPIYPWHPPALMREVNTTHPPSHPAATLHSPPRVREEGERECGDAQGLAVDAHHQIILQGRGVGGRLGALEESQLKGGGDTAVI